MTDLPVHWQPLLRQALHSGWQFRACPPGLVSPGHPLDGDLQGAGGWYSATVPGTVQSDLLAQGQMPDPYYGLNEPQVQWVGEQDWLYRLTFTPDEALLRFEQVELEFAGLDTLCTVWLNGEPLLSSDNMFVSHTLDVKSRLKNGENTLLMHFGSVLPAGRALEAQYGQRPAWNGDKSRVYLRKAQYHYGWDWGPVLLTCGPWRPVTLIGSSVTVADVHLPSEVTPDLKTAFIPVRVTLGGTLPESVDPASSDADAGDRLRLHAELRGPDGQVVQAAELAVHRHTDTLFEVQDPQLWYPSGQGEQPLYTVVVWLTAGDRRLSEVHTRTGLRRLRVVQEPVVGEPGRSFTFEINNAPVFVGGANWIPEDLMLDRVSPDRYRERLTQARDGNLNMVRVWGGGIYEPDVFYDLCDELGLLVWQDFMFACGLYPAHPEFLASVRQEAEQTVRRLRNHASLAIWAGNNEDYAVAESVGASGPGAEADRFEARVIYETLLPEVVEKFDAGRQYWPGSPWGGETSADPTTGDRHSWEVWHGPMARYQEYGRYQARFVSEFGMQSAPALSTLQASVPEAEQYPESRTLVHHNKATGPGGEPDGHRRMAVYLADNLRAYRSLDEYVYQTQFVQGEAMRYAYQAFRRRFEGPGRHAVSGALVWQLNDCWPVSSWAIVDSRGIAKPAYYTIKREMAALSVGLRRGAGDTRPGVQVWVGSSVAAAQRVRLELFAYTLDGKLLAQDSREVGVLPARSAPLAEWKLPELAPVDGAAVYYAALSLDGRVVARATDFPEPYKYHQFADPSQPATVETSTGLHAEYLSATTVRLSASIPTKGVWLDAGVPLDCDDNFIDLRPGEPRTVTFTSLDGLPLRVRALDTDPVTITLHRKAAEDSEATQAEPVGGRA
ncbi:glycosyl hydrolase 2 galactose-binding domain-containing protein [Deinococcus altitudinis]|uniref:beta-mannosidase n=1 Tax=Deinococcus altitudinis TaxID=468914 RepID=UPI0038914EFA